MSIVLKKGKEKIHLQSLANGSKTNTTTRMNPNCWHNLNEKLKYFEPT